MSNYDYIDARAAQLLADAAQQHIDKINDYIIRKLLDGVKVNTTFLTATVTELRGLIDRAAREAVTGPYQTSIIDGAKDGANDGKVSVGQSGMVKIDYDLVKLALFNTEVQIKDLATAAIKSVNEVITAAIVSGAGQKEIADQITAKLKELIPMSRKRAELIAHAELLSVYRQSQINLGNELGYDMFRYMGPDDYRNEDICIDALDVVTTLDEWQKVDPLIIQYGLHYGCRHQLVPVFLANPQAYKKTIGGITITAYKEAA